MLTEYFFQQRNGLYPVSQAAVDAACEHAKEQTPKESCGVVFNDIYHPMTNISNNPYSEWRINVSDYFDLMQEHGQPQAVIHSHPVGPRYPSMADLEYEATSLLTCGLIALHDKHVLDVVFWGNDVKRPPLIGRPFIYGVYDCFQLYRDAFYQDFGFRIKQCPTQEGWWEQDSPYKADVFLDNYAKYGFTQVDIGTVKKGDMLLGRVSAVKRVNHCAYYRGNGLIAHHFGGRLSNEDVIYQWKRYITHCLRHETQLMQVPAP